MLAVMLRTSPATQFGRPGRLAMATVAAPSRCLTLDLPKPNEKPKECALTRPSPCVYTLPKPAMPRPYTIHCISRKYVGQNALSKLTDSIARVQEACREAVLKADHILEEAERAASQERAAFLEDAEAAAAVSATQIQIIDETRALEASTRRELEKTRQVKYERVVATNIAPFRCAMIYTVLPGQHSFRSYRQASR